MPKVIELKGKDIIDAYNGDQLSRNFGFSCANFNCDYQETVDMNLFDIFVENPNNISCFVYINNDGKIEGRRMFYKGKQLLDDKIFPILTKFKDEIHYLYGFYGNSDDYFINRSIIRKVMETYGNGIIYMDHGYIDNRQFKRDRVYWIMEIENMDFDEFPSIDYLFVSPELSAFSSFNPSKNVKQWLKDVYDEDDIEFHSAYRFSKSSSGIDFMKHWNQKFFTDDEDNEYVQEDDDIQEEDIQEGFKLKKFKDL